MVEFQGLAEKDHVRIKRLSSYLETSSRSVWSNIFWYVKVCIFWMCIQYTIHWDKTQILKQLPSDKTNGTENALFSVANFNWSEFFFNLRFFYWLRHKIRLSKAVWDFRFSIPFRFCQSLYFCSIKFMDSLTLKCHNSSQN